MNQNQILPQLGTRIEEMRELLITAKFARQSGRKSLADQIDQEALEHRNKTLQLVDNWQELGLLPESLPDYVRNCLNIRSKVPVF
jgi:hypothetical protein